MLFLGAIFTIIIAVLQIQSSYPSELMVIIPIVFNRQNLLFLLLIFIVALIIYFLKIYFKKFSYKVSSHPVFDKEKEEANILVENIGSETIYCHARLEKILLNGQEKKVNDINPEGWYLRWDRKNQTELIDCAVLTKGIPRVLFFAGSYGNQLSIEFNNQTGAFLEDEGLYTFQIGFYRRTSNGYIRFAEFKDTLSAKLDEYGRKMIVKWIKATSQKKGFIKRDKN